MSSKGPLGPTWQPVYDMTYTLIMQTVNLPHLSVLTFIGIVVAHLRGDLVVHPLMPLVSLFVMARVPFVGLGMSLALHRYFAHSAFSTSRVGQFCLGILGSMALQGGVVWWAGKHVRHHKHCDTPLDPHSPTQIGSYGAWLGWLYTETRHDWAYIPKRIQTPELLILNLLFFFPNLLVTLSLVPYVGKEWALFLCWVPGLMGSLATTRFNVEYHPPKPDFVPGQCISVNKERGDTGIGPLRLEWLAKIAPWMFEPLVGEAFHDDHHAFPKRAHRPGYDMPYRLVLLPLARLGLIWDLHQPLDTDLDDFWVRKKKA
jgi:stearoyl-CoA desaturase (delta-9 desaturase)